MSDSDSRTLALLLSITFLSFLVSILTNSGYFPTAIFTTVGLPVVYTIRYFKDKELIGVVSAFIIGYLVFVATTNLFDSTGLYIYSIAFFFSIIIRFIILSVYSVINPSIAENPIFSTILGIAIAFLLAPIVSIFFLYTQ
ncbi:MAG: hypothetical protein QW540_04995 [Archaeoglobaceae archaeon]